MAHGRNQCEKRCGLGLHGGAWWYTQGKTWISNQACSVLVPALLDPPFSSEPHAPSVNERRALGHAAQTWKWGEQRRARAWGFVPSQVSLFVGEEGIAKSWHVWEGRFQLESPSTVFKSQPVGA